MKAIGALITLSIHLPLALSYMLFMGMSVAYSRHWPRWKAYPWGSLATVALGQGGLAFLMGWWASKPSPLTLTAWLGMLATICLSAGTYPLTQLYQVSVDQARGDQTFAARYGFRGVFILARLGQCLGGVCLIGVLYRQQRWIDMGVFSLILVASAWLLYDWQRHYQPQDTRTNYRRVMHMNLLNGGTFSAYILLRLWFFTPNI
jgi:4-hydroxybenzoate polyprenyltransferase